MNSPCYCNKLRTAARKVATVYDEALAPLGINIAQYSLLRTIERRQPASLTDVGRRAALERSTVGRNVRVLERMKLVTMGRGADQREAMVRLTPQGEEVLRAAAPVWQGCQRGLEERLGIAHIETLSRLLESL